MTPSVSSSKPLLLGERPVTSAPSVSVRRRFRVARLRLDGRVAATLPPTSAADQR